MDFLSTSGLGEPWWRRWDASLGDGFGVDLCEWDIAVLPHVVDPELSAPRAAVMIDDDLMLV